MKTRAGRVAVPRPHRSAAEAETRLRHEDTAVSENARDAAQRRRIDRAFGSSAQRVEELQPQGRAAAAQRHSLEEAAQEDEAVQAQRAPSRGVIQEKADEVIKREFDAEYNAGKKTEALNVLKTDYQLNAKDYALTADQLAKSSTHASTGGGWDSKGENFAPIRVRVNEPYLQNQVQSDSGYKKLLHTLGHEYQHVEQRSEKGWQKTADDSAKGEREFKAYSWEVLDAKDKNQIPDLDKKELLSTIRKAKKY